MALIKCDDCGRDVSDRAPACPNCGAPIATAVKPQDVPATVSIDGADFVATKPLLTRLAAKAIVSLNYRVDSADEASGLVSFTTGMTMGSWSGVSGSIFFEEVGQHRFRARGTAKQNVRGGQVLALDLFGEAGGKVEKVIAEMRRLAAPTATPPPSAPGARPSAGRAEFPAQEEPSDHAPLIIGGVLVALVIFVIAALSMGSTATEAPVENAVAATPANSAAAAPTEQRHHRRHPHHQRRNASASPDTNENIVDGEAVHRQDDNWVTEDGRVKAPAGD